MGTIDLGNYESQSVWTPSPDAQTADYSTSPIVASAPAPVIDVPRSDGITFDGILTGASRTADTLLSTFGKIYSLNSSVENAKFQRTVSEANQNLKQAQVMGALDVQKASVDAQVSIERARAARATNDALVQINSGRAGYITQNGRISPMVIVGGALLLGVVLYLRRGK